MFLSDQVPRCGNYISRLVGKCVASPRVCQASALNHLKCARRLRRELFVDELVDQLLADERGVALTGGGGFLPEMIKTVLERGMGAENLGYEKNDPASRGSGNSRNGTTPRR